MIILDPELLPQNCSQLLCQWLIVLCSYDVTFVMTSQSWAQPFLTSQSCVFNRALLSAAISLIYNTSVMFLWYSGLQLDPNYLFQWLFWHVLSDITLTLRPLNQSLCFQLSTAKSIFHPLKTRARDPTPRTRSENNQSVLKLTCQAIDCAPL